jgi:hypothetical protein
MLESVAENSAPDFIVRFSPEFVNLYNTLADQLRLNIKI